jgi:phosphoglycerate kinase
VLVRCDLNVPLAGGRVADDLRIEASLPTLRELLERGARPAVCSHLGRPKGRVEPELSMAPVAERLGELLGSEVTAAEDVVGPSARAACASDDAVVVLENLRFDPGEEANEADFSDRLGSLAGAYVNDAFGSSHRAHASIVGVAGRLPAAAGRLLTTEVERLERLLVDAGHPFVAVLGGAKVSDKLGVIANLLTRVDAICVGGAMAFTLLAAAGTDVGKSPVEADRLEEVARVLERARGSSFEIVLPSDVVAADEPVDGAPYEVTGMDGLRNRYGVDIGPDTADAFRARIVGARSVLWNGPMGIFEVRQWAAGTRAIAEAIAEATRGGAYTVAGGGDSAAALRALGRSDAVTHLSTGGGASLDLLEGKRLPGVEALRAARRAA